MIEPKVMPMHTNTTRASGTGIATGLPAMAAAPTATTEPEISPAGTPSRSNTTPPTVAKISASRRRRSMGSFGSHPLVRIKLQHGRTVELAMAMRGQDAEQRRGLRGHRCRHVDVLRQRQDH